MINVYELVLTVSTSSWKLSEERWGQRDNATICHHPCSDCLMVTCAELFEYCNEWLVV